MKRICSVILCFLLLISLAACQEEKPKTKSVEIKNIILIIGDGCGLEHMKAAELCTGEDAPYRSWPNAVSNTTNAHSQITDSAAGATALATGTLVSSGVVAVGQQGEELKTIMDYAAEKGKATGVVTTDTLNGATPAAFSGHNVSRDNALEILESQLSSGVNLLCAQNTESVRKWCKDASFNTRYAVCQNDDQIQENMGRDNVCWLLPLEEDLSLAVAPALKYLEQDEDGFVLMIEQAHVDKNADDNLFEETVRCVKDLNETVDTVLEWIGDREDTAVIITADHETGALQVLTEEQSLYTAYESEEGNTVYYFFGTVNHTAREVGLFVYGYTPDFTPYYMEGSTTTVKNSDIFQIMLDLLNDPVRNLEA